MKKLIIICIVILGIVSIGASFRGVPLGVLLNEYEEVCDVPQMNVTYEIVCPEYKTFSTNLSTTFNQSFYQSICASKHNYIPTEKCRQFKLVRKTGIENNYLFDWCEVYPDGEGCNK